MLERRRAPAARNASSLRGSGWLGVGDSETVGVGVGIGDGSGVGATVASGLVVSMVAAGAIFQARWFVVPARLVERNPIRGVATVFVATPAVPDDTGGLFVLSPSADR